MNNKLNENTDWTYISYRYPILLVQKIAEYELGRELTEDEMDDIEVDTLEDKFWKLATEAMREAVSKKSQH